MLEAMTVAGARYKYFFTTVPVKKNFQAETHLGFVADIRYQIIFLAC